MISGTQKDRWTCSKENVEQQQQIFVLILVLSNTRNTFAVLPSSVFQCKLCFMMLFLVQGFYSLCLNGAIL